MEQTKKQKVVLPALRAAFPKTIPVMAGYFFLGVTYGIYMKVSGFSFIYPLIQAIVIFGGSLEFIVASMLLSAFNPLATLLMTLMVQARHFFYGISMLEKYKGTGIKKIYLIYAMSDETFSVNCSSDIPDGVDAGWFYFFVSLLDQLYWVISATLGGLLGNFITFDTTGIDFVMTAMFVVILLEKILKDKKPYTAIIGFISSIACLLIFGPSNFLIPTMLSIVALLTIFKKPLERAGGVL